MSFFTDSDEDDLDSYSLTSLLDSDLDFAFSLQLQEALKASLEHQTPPARAPTVGIPYVLPEERLALRLDSELHSASVGEASSSGGADTREFRMYVKGMVSEDGFCRIGAAICDERDEFVEGLNAACFVEGKSNTAAEVEALIEGLNLALGLKIERLVVYIHCYPVYQFINRRWKPKQRKISLLMDQAFLLLRKFTHCGTKLVSGNDHEHVFRLARAAIVPQSRNTVESSDDKKIIRNCVICLEDNDLDKMFSVDGCLHQYCFSCMKQHIEAKLLHGMLPKCPHEGCKSELCVENCGKFLTANVTEKWSQQIREASIPVTERVYCPRPKCSTLMSMTEINESAKDAFVGGRRHSGARKCVKCHGLFCVNCKVPWHRNLTCRDYKMLHPVPTEDVKLQSLASRNLWRQCIKCNHMIELSEGCFHMTCRCEYEFCFNCGQEWKNKKATCSCPLWDEDNIWHDDEDRDFDDEDDD